MVIYPAPIKNKVIIPLGFSAVFPISKTNGIMAAAIAFEVVIIKLLPPKYNPERFKPVFLKSSSMQSIFFFKKKKEKRKINK